MSPEDARMFQVALEFDRRARDAASQTLSFHEEAEEAAVELGRWAGGMFRAFYNTFWSRRA